MKIIIGAYLSLQQSLIVYPKNAVLTTNKTTITSGIECLRRQKLVINLPLNTRLLRIRKKHREQQRNHQQNSFHSLGKKNPRRSEDLNLSVINFYCNSSSTHSPCPCSWQSPLRRCCSVQVRSAKTPWLKTHGPKKANAVGLRNQTFRSEALWL